MGEELALKIPPEIREKLTPLPYDHGRYFKAVKGLVLVQVGLLTPSRLRPGGILRANELMIKAYHGEWTKRDPIVVTKAVGGTFLIKDGNSTYMNAVFSGWKDIPAVYAKSE